MRDKTFTLFKQFPAKKKRKNISTATIANLRTFSSTFIAVEKIVKETDENSNSHGARVRYHYGFYGRLKKGVGKTQKFNLGISGQSYTSAFPRRDARFHLRERSRAGAPNQSRRVVRLGFYSCGCARTRAGVINLSLTR